MGTYLKSCNAIDTDQLRLLFDAQVVANMCKLFGEIHHGRFNFDPQAPLIYAEMTEISVNAGEVSSIGLRMLRDWSRSIYSFSNGNLAGQWCMAGTVGTPKPIA